MLPSARHSLSISAGSLSAVACLGLLDWVRRGSRTYTAATAPLLFLRLPAYCTSGEQPLFRPGFRGVVCVGFRRPCGEGGFNSFMGLPAFAYGIPLHTTLCIWGMHGSAGHGRYTSAARHPAICRCLPPQGCTYTGRLHPTLMHSSTAQGRDASVARYLAICRPLQPQSYTYIGRLHPTTNAWLSRAGQVHVFHSTSSHLPPLTATGLHLH